MRGTGCCCCSRLGVAVSGLASLVGVICRLVKVLEISTSNDSYLHIVLVCLL